MAFDDAFDMIFTLKHDLETMLNFPTFLSKMTDSNSLFDVITRTANTTEKG